MKPKAFTRQTGLEPEATRRSFSAAWEDYDNDGDSDFYVANDYGRNNLFRNDGGTFVDVAGPAGVEGPTKVVGEDEGAEYAEAFRATNRMVNEGHSWSGYERNRCFLNTGAARFANVSATSGLDFIDDARAIGVTDWDTDGDLDVLLVNRTAPQLRFVRNDWNSGGHWLELRLASAFDILAAAYAETGDFEKAKEMARNAISLAEAKSRGDFVHDVKARLKLYETGKAFRQEAN